MLYGRFLLCVVLVAAWHSANSASLPPLVYASFVIGDLKEMRSPGEVVRARLREGAPPHCAGRCTAPPTGPLCAFDAAGTARTFHTLCELEAVSCRERTYYAITSLGEC